MLFSIISYFKIINYHIHHKNFHYGEKDLTKENLIELLNCEDSYLRKTTLGYYLRQILNENEPPIDIILLRQNSAMIVLNE